MALAMAMLVYGCGRERGELFPETDWTPAWPEPPENPRIRYIGQLSTQDDLKKEVSFLEDIGEFFFGREDMGVMVRPYHVVMDQNDNLLISDSSGSIVHMMNLKTRNYRQISRLTKEKTLHTPVGVATGQKYIYVSDSGLGEIYVFDYKGKFQFSFGGDILERPAGIAYDRADQKLYIADILCHKVIVYDTDGHYINAIGRRGMGTGQFNFPTHLWIDESGKLYVSDTLNYRVQVFNRQGEFLFRFGRQGDRILMAFGSEGNDPGRFWLPAGIFIDDNNRIFVADSFNKRIQVFQLLEVEQP